MFRLQGTYYRLRYPSACLLSTSEKPISRFVLFSASTLTSLCAFSFIYKPNTQRDFFFLVSLELDPNTGLERGSIRTPGGGRGRTDI